MLADEPRALLANLTDDEPDAPTLDAPEYLVQRYVELTNQRRALDEQIAVIRAELEMLAAATLNDASPKGRFRASGGQVTARLQPTCVFDRTEVYRQLQRAGRLHEVATVTGPALARFLAKEPQLAARLGELVRPRHVVVLTTVG